MLEQLPAAVQMLLQERQAARQRKDWGEADRIRDQLKELGYAVKDTPQGIEITRV